MYVLQQAVYQLLNAIPELNGKVKYFTLPVDTPLPYVEYWTGDGAPDPDSGFGEQAREYSIYIQASSRDGVIGQQLYDVAHQALEYARLDVPDWHQRGLITWVHELDDPGDPTQDDDMVYYTGGCFNIKLFRQRTN